VKVFEFEKGEWLTTVEQGAVIGASGLGTCIRFTTSNGRMFELTGEVGVPMSNEDSGKITKFTAKKDNQIVGLTWQESKLTGIEEIPVLDPRHVEALRNMGAALFANAQNQGAQDREVTDRIDNSLKDQAASSLSEQIRLLGKINPGLNNSKRWRMKVNGDNSRWMRTEVEGETLISEDQWVLNRDLEREQGTVLEVQGWRRQFLPVEYGSRKGYREVDFVHASQQVGFFPCRDGSVTSITFRELDQNRSRDLERKTAWFYQKMEGLKVPWDTNHKDVKIHRDRAFEESYKILRNASVMVWRSPFKIEFIGEPGIDAGGLTRDWFKFLLDHALLPANGMFKFSETDCITSQIDEHSPAPLDKFKFVGMLLGKALIEKQAIGVHLTVPLLKLIVGAPITWHDLQYKDQPYYEQMQKMVEEKKENIEYYGVYFTVPGKELGSEIELKPGGTDIEVTGDNCKEFIQLAVKYKLLTCQQDKVGALLSGLFEVLPEPFLAVFEFNEMELMLGGVANIDVEDWRRNTTWNGIAAGGNVKEWFFAIIKGWNHETRAKFLQFVTGTSQVPIGGFKNLQGRYGQIQSFTVNVMLYNKQDKFPKAHTCFNRIDLPKYWNKAEMAELMMACTRVDFSVGFGTQ